MWQLAAALLDLHAPAPAGSSLPGWVAALARRQQRPAPGLLCGRWAAGQARQSRSAPCRAPGSLSPLAPPSPPHWIIYAPGVVTAPCSSPSGPAALRALRRGRLRPAASCASVPRCAWIMVAEARRDRWKRLRSQHAVERWVCGSRSAKSGQWARVAATRRGIRAHDKQWTRCSRAAGPARAGAGRSARRNAAPRRSRPPPAAALHPQPPRLPSPSPLQTRTADAPAASEAKAEPAGDEIYIGFAKGDYAPRCGGAGSLIL